MKPVLPALLLLTGCLETAGQFSVSWAIVVNGTVQPDLASTCANLGAERLQVLTTRVGEASGRSFTYACKAGSGLTDPLPAGDYAVTYALLDGQGQPLATVAATQVGTLLGRDVVTLDRAQFAYTFSNVMLKVHLGDPSLQGGNCGPTSGLTPGAGATGQQLFVSPHGASQCMAFTLSGVDNGGASTAPTCDPTTCQPEDFTQVINGLPDGSYDLVVHGLQGTAVCYIGSTPLTVGGADVDLGILYAPFDAHLNAGGCH